MENLLSATDLSTWTIYRNSHPIPVAVPAELTLKFLFFSHVQSKIVRSAMQLPHRPENINVHESSSSSSFRVCGVQLVVAVFKSSEQRGLSFLRQNYRNQRTRLQEYIILYPKLQNQGLTFPSMDCFCFRVGWGWDVVQCG